MPRVHRLTMQPKLRALFDLWTEVKEDKQMPALAWLPIEMLKQWLPNLAIIGVKRESGYIYRYYGKTFVSAFGVNMTGFDLDSLPGPQRDILQHEYEYVRERRKPTWRVYSGEFDGMIVTFERLILPFSHKGEAVDSLVIAVYEVKNDGVFDVG